ncbi:MAG: 5-(carboxyamino)imidazole ribonucleotide synthase [Fimbriimonadaceae bacterium]|jgi:5-(carboxyamino)imidazole ribonucleotide synthase|nr:5-(carboxyamino)imidazole ribonucleotide synthase [Fimbriimonadaceae bacterium]
MRFDIGFLGGGQLARMSIQAAQRMGLKCISLDPGEQTPASELAPAIVGDLNDPDKIAELARQSDRLALENEFIPAVALREGLKKAGVPETSLIPEIDTLATIQDKLLQRQALLSASVPSPNAVPIEADGSQAISQIGFPMVLKARFGGYDGRGTRYARTMEEFQSHAHLWEKGGWMAESFVPFRRELAAMVFIDRQGKAGCFPTMETVQTNHVCDLVFPAGVDASETAIAAVRAVNGHGLFGVEMFELEDGSVQINELAPRPHNTGHYTLDWGGVSQFEQHVRLVMDLPTVQPSGQDTCMANLLGEERAGDYRNGLRAALKAEREARVHWYGKAASRPGRKMGHINVVGADSVERAKRAREAFYAAWGR